MIDHNFEVQDRQKSDLPDFLKKRQTGEGQKDPDQNRAVNKIIHVDLINADPHLNEASGKTILSITDNTRTFTQVAIIANSGIDSTASAIWHYWCQPYGPPETILFNQGKVHASKLESRINDFMPLGQKISCRSRKDTFNQEIQQQWQQNQYDISAEEFAQNFNFLCNLQSPNTTGTGYPDHRRLNNVHQNFTHDEDFTEVETDTEKEELEKLPRINHKRKWISLCRHKLQGRAYHRFRELKMTPKQPEQEEVEPDHEWLQLIQMERMIERQKQELPKNGAQDFEDEDDGWDELREAEEGPVKEEDDSLDDGDLTYITAILNSFSKPKLNCEQSSASELQPFTPEGALTRAPAQIMTPPKFNQKFNQNSTSYNSEQRNFSCFSNFEEEGTTELADYFSDKEDDSLDNEDRKSESDIWSQSHLDKLGEISDKEDDNSNDEDAWSEHRATKFGLKSIQEIDYEEVSEKNNLQQISSILNKAELAFSEWQPYIPPEPVFRNLFAQSWWSAFSQLASSSQDPTLIQISTIKGPIATTKQTQAPRLAISPQQKITPSQQQDWNSFRPATRHYTHIWRKLWPGSSGMCNRTNNSQNKFPDHLE